ncbi:helix-turn-helix domain-containing protein [Alkalibacterium iburiense]|uniref:Helix-turn-helix domain-containing protein n=1 Tax=Alkalibacterium iburiense TaxID=290589 RepID=A0ABP3H560_9LACT
MNEIGEKLKEARKEKGYTLDDLQQITKIQKRYLIAVEEGNLEVLPGNFYARAFIKQYADSVGLNGEQLIKEHIDALPQTDQSSYVAKSAPSTQTRSRGKNSGFLATLQDSLPTILIVLLVIAIIVAIYLAMSSANRNADDSSFIQEDESSNVVEVDDNDEIEEAGSDEDDPEGEGETPADDEDQEEEEPEEPEEPEEQVIEETDGSTNTTTYTVTGEHPESQQLELTADGGESWVSVEVDGEMANQALLTDGQSLVTEFDNNASSIVIVIGNASATTISLNENPLPYGEAATEAVRQEMYIEFE